MLPDEHPTDASAAAAKPAARDGGVPAPGASSPSAQPPEPANRGQALTETLDGSAARPPAPGAAAAEVYSVEGEIARGGLGRILRAHDNLLGRTVAIKELL